ncbi:MAG: BlaI/MecI/CopY family transcriptional regulator [Oscillospiraceae bacterium]|nr:BlaI/MecI/CopY family transcriptional regulator [Oscillospiraceae bacterium]
MTRQKKLPDAELEIMQVVWECPCPAPRAEIEQRMAERRPLAQSTLLTVLTRLAEKGFLRIEKDGRSSVYYPLISREEYQAGQSRRFVDQVFGGSISAFACALTASGLSREELDELRRLLEEDSL